MPCVRHPLVLTAEDGGELQTVQLVRILEAAIVAKVKVHLHKDDVSRREGDAETKDVEHGRQLVASEGLEKFFLCRMVLFCFGFFVFPLRS